MIQIMCSFFFNFFSFFSPQVEGCGTREKGRTESFLFFQEYVTYMLRYKKVVYIGAKVGPSSQTDQIKVFSFLVLVIQKRKAGAVRSTIVATTK